MDLHISVTGRAKISVDRRIIPGAPEYLRGLKAVFVSDVHLTKSMDPDAIAALIMDAQPDLILLGGDYSDEREQALRLFDAFRTLRAPLGIYGCVGNNDLEAFDSSDALARAMEKSGAVLLDNKSVAVTVNGNVLRIGGIGEYKYVGADYSRVFPKNDDGFRLLLSHYPILPDASVAERPDLILAGHTHGGQFNAFGLNPYSIGFERIGKCYPPPVMVSGLLKFGPTLMLTSKGIGASRLPLRIGVRPEVHFLTFSA